MASVEVFVDDAVRGLLPHVCAKTGARADGKLRVEQARGGMGAGWLLVFLGPLGWLVLVVLAVTTRRESLTLRLPYSAEAVDRELRLVHARFAAISAAAVFAIGGVVVDVSPLRELFAVAAIATLVVAAIAHVCLAWVRVTIRLDASRRWVTLSGVHPAFAIAVKERDAVDRRAALDLSH
jgi:hypothetical protein